MDPNDEYDERGSLIKAGRPKKPEPIEEVRMETDPDSGVSHYEE